MKRLIAVLVVSLSSVALAQTCDYYPLNTCAQNILGKKTFLDGISVPGGITTDGGASLQGPVTINGDLTVNGDAGVSGNKAVFGSISVSGDAGIAGSASIGGSLSVNGVTNTSDAGISGNVTINGTLAGQDAGFNSISAKAIPGFAQKMIWSTQDVTENSGANNSRVLLGPLTTVDAGVGTIDCQLLERGDGGGRFYVNVLADQLDGGFLVLCASDFGPCDGTGFPALAATSTGNGSCNSQVLSAGTSYIMGLGYSLDGGPHCGLNTPRVSCTSILNPP